MYPAFRFSLLLLLVCPLAPATTMLLNSTFDGSVRRSTDGVLVNLFSSGTGTVSFANNPSPEFTANILVGLIPVLVTADFHGFFNQFTLAVSLVNPRDAASVPAFVFSFSNLQFSPISTINGVGFSGGSPGSFGPVVMTGFNAFTVSTNQQFLSNGGSFGGAFQLNLTDGGQVPEVSSWLLVAAGLAVVANRGGKSYRPS